MATNRKSRANSAASQNIKSQSELIFRTSGAFKTKYSVVIGTDSQLHFFHLADVRSPGEAFWLSFLEYFSNPHSQNAITEILVIGYSQTKKEREQGTARAHLHFPPLPTSE